MKKTVLIFLAVFMCFILIACDNQNTATITCVNCGEKNATNAKFCQSCGKSVSSSNNEEDNTDITDDSSNSNTDTQKPHEHSFKSTVTEPTCTTAGYTTYACECGTAYKDDYKDAEGHKWNEATCITPKMCPVCKATEGEPEGHTFEDGECIYCYEDDPDYVALTLTSTKYNINLEENSDVAYITMIGGETITYDIDDTSVVRCEWGEWDGDVIPLSFFPVSVGETVVTVYIKDTNKSIQINVEVIKHTHNYSNTLVTPTCTEQGYTLYSCDCGYSYRDDYIKANGHTEVIVPGVEPTLTSTGLTAGKYCFVCQKVLVKQETIPMLELTPADETTFELTNKLSETYGYYNSRLQAYTKCKIDSVDCEIVNSSGGKVTLKIKLLVEKTYQGDTSLDNLKFDYTIYRNGVAVKSSFVTILHTEFGTLYETTITYTGEAGEYTMKCESYY